MLWAIKLPIVSNDDCLHVLFYVDSVSDSVSNALTDSGLD